MIPATQRAPDDAETIGSGPNASSAAKTGEDLLRRRKGPEKINFYSAWIGILLGFVTGIIQGSYFADPEWLGGYASWTRRLLRLGHISLIGLALINLAFVFSVAYLGLRGKRVSLSSGLFLAGQITMPVVCYLCAFRENYVYLFSVPVLSLLGGALVFLWAGFDR